MSTETLPQLTGPHVDDDWVHAACPLPEHGRYAVCGEDMAGHSQVDGDDVPLTRVCVPCLTVLEAFEGCPRCQK